YFVEKLTADMEEKCLALMEKIDNMGGSVSAIEQGFMQNEIANSAYSFQKNVEDNSKIIVGVNKFTVDEKNTTPVFKIDESIQRAQSERLKSLRERRDNVKCNECLLRLKKAAEDEENLMPFVIDAVENL